MDEQLEITQEMSIENLIVILKTHSRAIKSHEDTIQKLTELNAQLLQSQQTLNERVEILKSNLESVQRVLLRAIPRQGAGPEAN